MRSLFETPPEHAFYRFWSTFGVHLGTLWKHFFNMFFDLIFEPTFRLSWKSAKVKSGAIPEPPSPGPLTLLTLLSKKQGTMQRPSQTQRVLALPVIRRPLKASSVLEDSNTNISSQVTSSRPLNIVKHAMTTASSNSS